MIKKEILKKYKENVYNEYSILNIAEQSNSKYIFKVLIEDIGTIKKHKLIHNIIVLLTASDKKNIIEYLVEEYNETYDIKFLNNIKQYLKTAVETDSESCVHYYLKKIKENNIKINNTLLAITVFKNNIKFFKIIFKDIELTNYEYSNLILQAGDTESWEIFNYIINQDRFKSLPEECLKTIYESYEKEIKINKNIKNF